MSQIQCQMLPFQPTFSIIRSLSFSKIIYHLSSVERLFFIIWLFQAPNQLSMLSTSTPYQPISYSTNKSLFHVAVLNTTLRLAIYFDCETCRPNLSQKSPLFNVSTLYIWCDNHRRIKDAERWREHEGWYRIQRAISSYDEMRESFAERPQTTAIHIP